MPSAFMHSKRPPASRKTLLAGACLGLLLSACSPAALRTDTQARRPETIDSLIVFKEAVASGNALRAVRLLPETDRAALLDGKGRVRQGMEPRLRALRWKDLVDDPRVRLENGKITGIPAALPTLEKGAPAASDSSFLSSLGEGGLGVGSGAASPGGGKDGTGEEDRKAADSAKAAELHAAAQLLFSDIRSGSWQYTLSDMHPSTQAVFLDGNGKLKEGMKARLAAIDTSAWRSLALRDGRLVGVSLLLPPPHPRLDSAAGDFFRAVAAEDWKAALGLLADAERKALAGSDGGIKPAYAPRLAALDPADWDALLWRKGKLAGVLDLLGEGEGEGARPQAVTRDGAD